MYESIYNRSPLAVTDGIPVFSQHDEYIENYKRISDQHLESLQKNGTNPFMEEGMLVEFETSTAKVVKEISRPGEKILDVGVGLGRLLDYLPEYDRYGMDISLGYLSIAKSKGIDVCYSSIEDMPYCKGSFDIAVCTDVLEHVLDLHSACEKVLSVLRKDGILLVRVPHREDLSHYLSPEYPFKFVHLRNFDENSLRLHFERVFNCAFVMSKKIGISIERNYLKYILPIPKYATIVGGVVFRMKTMHLPTYKLLAKAFYDPCEIIMVFRKQN